VGGDVVSLAKRLAPTDEQDTVPATQMPMDGEYA